MMQAIAQIALVATIGYICYLVLCSIGHKIIGKMVLMTCALSVVTVIMDLLNKAVLWLKSITIF